MSDGRDAIERRPIVALENDLFFAVKITDTLKRAGFQTRISRTASEFRNLLLSGDYALALVNTAARGVDWRAGVSAAQEAGVPVIAYGPHVDLDTQAAARAAGAARVIANSRLAELPAIIERVIARAASQIATRDRGIDAPESGALSDDERSDDQPDDK